jgi:N-acetylmuramoyl-L-alanine amidase
MTSLLRILGLLVACAFCTAAQAANFRTVVIDPGHGGHDNGGQWGKVYEKHLALDTALRLEGYLKRMGYRTVMTRRGDYFVSLQDRAKIANRYRDAIFVSIHFNYTWKQQVCGMETFYYNSGGQPLARFVQGAMIRNTRTQDRSAKFARYYVIRNTKMPSILVEGGFVSNPRERERMKSAVFREGIARGVAEGIARYRRG